jgi:hypothetical protein
VNPDIVNQLFSIAQVVGPAIAAFFVGHYHVVLKNPAIPATPKTVVPAPVVPAPVATAPTTPVAPVGQGGILQVLSEIGNTLPPVNPAAPIAPAGQGGILQVTTLLLQAILAGQATPAAKAAAINQVVSATQSLETPEVK